MKILIQVVKEASVLVDNVLISTINKGYLLFVGIESSDSLAIVEKMANKLMTLRINQDENGKTNLSIKDINGEILSVSQFTLCAKIDGRRPSFSNAMNPADAQKYYLHFNEILRSNNLIVKEGKFKEHMEVKIINDGPFTIYLDSDNI